jgi:hypothetical protein
MFGNYGAEWSTWEKTTGIARVYDYFFPPTPPTPPEETPVYDWNQPQSIPAESTPWKPTPVYDWRQPQSIPPEASYKPVPTVPKPAQKPAVYGPVAPPVTIPPYNPDVQNQIMALAARQDAMNAQQSAFLAKLAAPAVGSTESSTNTRVIIAGAVGIGALLLLLRAVR